jgi:phage protein D
MTDLAVHPFASHAPVFVVDENVEGAIGRDLLRLDVEEGPLGLRTLVAHLLAIGPDSDGSADMLSYLDGELVGLGSVIDVDIGPPGGERRIFHGTISAIEANFGEGTTPYVSVFAEDALMRLRMAERTATYSDLDDAGIVEEVVGHHGLAVQTDVDGPTYPMVQQWEESDLAFLRDRAVLVNAELWVGDDDTVHFADRDRRPGAELDLVQGGELIAVEARVDLAHQRSEIEYRGWDDARVEAVSATATSDDVRATVAGGRVGPEVVADVFEQAGTRRSRRDVLSADAARVHAVAEMRRRARSFVTVDGTTSGTPDLVPGAHLTLHRVGRPFDGDGYRVVAAHHSYDPTTGYRTRFRAERPGVVG